MTSYLVELTDHSFVTPPKFYWHDGIWAGRRGASTFPTKKEAQALVRRQIINDKHFPARKNTYRVITTEPPSTRQKGEF